MKNRWATHGTGLFFLIALGHFLIVDLSISLLGGSWVKIGPIPGLLPLMRRSTVDFALFGSNSMFNLFAGFSLFIPLLFLSLGIFNKKIFRGLEKGHSLRVFAIQFSLGISVLLQIMADIFFIYPPMLAGVLGIVFFSLALKEEQK